MPFWLTENGKTPSKKRLIRWKPWRTRLSPRGKNGEKITGDAPFSQALPRSGLDGFRRLFLCSFAKQAGEKDEDFRVGFFPKGFL
jgi:hypothetical protein